MTTAEGVHCYACDNTYRYLGGGFHPGRCQRCSSHCVSPAGELRVIARSDGSSTNDAPAVTVLAIDERDRHFHYDIGVRGDSSVLNTLEVDGHLVGPDSSASGIPIPEPVANAVYRTESITGAGVTAGSEPGGR